ncbi:MAG: hypothetical protein ACLQVG_21025 [Terriglobia bacterium]
MAGVGLQVHSLAWVKLSDGIHQSQDAIGDQFVDLHVRREMFAHVEGDSMHQWKHFNQQALPAIVAIQPSSRSVRSAVVGRCVFNGSQWGFDLIHSLLSYLMYFG